jgi:excisionase family DNA binding protein
MNQARVVRCRLPERRSRACVLRTNHQHATGGIAMPRLKKKWLQSALTEKITVVPETKITPAFLNIEQAAQYFGVTTWTIRRLITTGNLRSKLFGKRLLIKRTDIDALWESEPAFTGMKRKKAA